ncbi:hypothetical protein CLOP_g1978 [Closterium sp. NIES-67]|nr:hypothetical protein CLOP_g1978 [Closterium sp. NIES-67]
MIDAFSDLSYDQQVAAAWYLGLPIPTRADGRRPSDAEMFLRVFGGSLKLTGISIGKRKASGGDGSGGSDGEEGSDGERGRGGEKGRDSGEVTVRSGEREFVLMSDRNELSEADLAAIEADLAAYVDFASSIDFEPGSKQGDRDRGGDTISNSTSGVSSSGSRSTSSSSSSTSSGGKGLFGFGGDVARGLSDAVQWFKSVTAPDPTRPLEATTEPPLPSDPTKLQIPIADPRSQSAPAKPPLEATLVTFESTQKSPRSQSAPAKPPLEATLKPPLPSDPRKALERTTVSPSSSSDCIQPTEAAAISSPLPPPSVPPFPSDPSTLERTAVSPSSSSNRTTENSKKYPTEAAAISPTAPPSDPSESLELTSESPLTSDPGSSGRVTLVKGPIDSPIPPPSDPSESLEQARKPPLTPGPTSPFAAASETALRSEPSTSRGATTTGPPLMPGGSTGPLGATGEPLTPSGHSTAHVATTTEPLLMASPAAATEAAASSVVAVASGEAAATEAAAATAATEAAAATAATEAAAAMVAMKAAAATALGAASVLEAASAGNPRIGEGKVQGGGSKAEGRVEGEGRGKEEEQGGLDIQWKGPFDVTVMEGVAEGKGIRVVAEGGVREGERRRGVVEGKEERNGEEEEREEGEERGGGEREEGEERGGGEGEEGEEREEGEEEEKDEVGAEEGEEEGGLVATADSSSKTAGAQEKRKEWLRAERKEAREEEREEEEEGEEEEEEADEEESGPLAVADGSLKGREKQRGSSIEWLRAERLEAREEGGAQDGEEEAEEEESGLVAVADGSLKQRRGSSKEWLRAERKRERQRERRVVLLAAQLKEELERQGREMRSEVRKGGDVSEEGSSTSGVTEREVKEVVRIQERMEEEGEVTRDLRGRRGGGTGFREGLLLAARKDGEDREVGEVGEVGEGREGGEDSPTGANAKGEKGGADAKGMGEKEMQAISKRKGLLDVEELRAVDLGQVALLLGAIEGLKEVQDLPKLMSWLGGVSEEGGGEVGPAGGGLGGDDVSLGSAEVSQVLYELAIAEESEKALALLRWMEGRREREWGEMSEKARRKFLMAREREGVERVGKQREGMGGRKVSGGEEGGLFGPTGTAYGAVVTMLLRVGRVEQAGAMAMGQHSRSRSRKSSKSSRSSGCNSQSSSTRQRSTKQAPSGVPQTPLHHLLLPSHPPLPSPYHNPCTAN